MDKKLVLFGIGDFGRLMKYYVENDTNRQVTCFTVNEQYLNNTTFEGYPLYSVETLPQKLGCDAENIEILICVGYSALGENRKKVYDCCKQFGYTIASFIHSTALVAGNVKIGDGNIILERVVIQPFAKIGNANLLWHNSVISHDCMIGSFNTFCSTSVANGFVKVEDNCFIGSNATIRDRIEVKKYSLIGAGVYVSTNTEKYGVYKVGNTKKSDYKSTSVRL